MAFSFKLNKDQISAYIAAVKDGLKAASKLSPLGAGRNSCIQLSIQPGSEDDQPDCLKLTALQNSSHSIHIAVPVEKITTGHVIVTARDLYELTSKISDKQSLEVTTDREKIYYKVRLKNGFDVETSTHIAIDQELFEGAALIGNNNGFKLLSTENKYFNYLLPKLGTICSRSKFLQVEGINEDIEIFGRFTDVSWVEYRFSTESTFQPFSCNLPIEAISSFNYKSASADYSIFYSYQIPKGAIKLSNSGRSMTILGTQQFVEDEKSGFKKLLALPSTGSFTILWESLHEPLEYMKNDAREFVTLSVQDDRLVLHNTNNFVKDVEVLIETIRGNVRPITVELSNLLTAVNLVGGGAKDALLPTFDLLVEFKEITRPGNKNHVTRSLCIRNNNVRDCDVRVLITEVNFR